MRLGENGMPLEKESSLSRPTFKCERRADTMRVAIGGIMHESNTFASTGTPLAAVGVLRGQEILAAYTDGFHEVAGFIQAAMELGFELVPTLLAGATPPRTVTPAACEA